MLLALLEGLLRRPCLLQLVRDVLGGNGGGVGGVDAGRAATLLGRAGEVVAERVPPTSKSGVWRLQREKVCLVSMPPLVCNAWPKTDGNMPSCQACQSCQAGDMQPQKL